MNDKHDLSWRAFRYISDEMTADEVAAFEELLAVDQQAREETARCVELAQAIAAGPPVEPRRASQPREWSKRLAWMLVGTAACLAAVASVKLWKSSEADRLVANSNPAAPSWVNEQAAATWVDSLALSESDATDEVADAVLPLPLVADAEAEVAESEVVVPGWLLAALSTQPEASGVEPSRIGPTPVGPPDRLEN